MIKFEGKDTPDDLVKLIMKVAEMTEVDARIAVAFSLEWASDYAARYYGALHAATDFSQIAADVGQEYLEKCDR